MAKIKWNNVTWYSKLIALVLFVGLPFLFFYYGVQYGETVSYVEQSSAWITTSTAPSASTYYSNPAEWQIDSNNTKGGFSIAYPIDFSATDNYPATPSTDWRENSNNEPGVQYFSLTAPSAFEPQTNFAGATLTVGASSNGAAVSQCLTPDQNAQNGSQSAATSSATIDGVAFTIFHSDSAGAGSEYDTTSYRTRYNGQCYAIEYTIHSSQIANYPSSYDLQPFDANAIDSVMQTVVGTFKFI